MEERTVPDFTRPPVVVVDTTAIRPDLLLKSGSWERCLALCSRGMLRLYVPEVVIREALRHHQREIAKATKQAVDALAALSRLDIRVTAASSSELREEATKHAAKYEIYLRDRLTKVGANTLKLPAVSHEDLLDRTIADRQPFKETGEGYRDALIWASLMELAAHLEAEDDLLIVTANTKDFCGSDGQLAEPLHHELLALDTLTKVRVYRDVKEMLVGIEDGLDALLEDGPDETFEWPAPLEEQLANAVLSFCDELAGRELRQLHEERSSGLDFDDVPLPSGMQNITIYNVDADPDSLDWDVYDRYEGGTFLAAVRINAHVTLDGFMYKSDYFADGEGVELFDSDWNDHMVWVFTEREVQLAFHVTLDPEAEQIQDVEFDSASSQTGYYRASR